MKIFITTAVMTSTLLCANTLTVVDEGKVEEVAQSMGVVTMDANRPQDDTEYQEVTVKDAGVEFTIRVVKPKKQLQGLSASSSKEKASLDKINSKVGLIVDFTNTEVDIQTFMSRFDLKLQTKMAIGYYIFENHSNLTDILLMNKVLQSDMKDKIKTIRPNWPMEMVTF